MTIKIKVVSSSVVIVQTLRCRLMSCNNLILIIKQNKIGWIAKVGICATNLSRYLNDQKDSISQKGLDCHCGYSIGCKCI